MTDYEQTRIDQDSPAYRTPSSASGRRFVMYGSAFLLLAVVAAGGYFALRGVTTPNGSCDGEEQDSPPSLVQAPVEYHRWPTPNVALVVTGQMHGYVDPCGCSEPQHGGLVRRYNFIESLKQKKWDVVGIDLGELAQLQGIHAQNLLKFDLSIKALGTMNYRAVGIGKHELLSPLGEGLAQIWDNKHPYPRPLALSLDLIAPGQMYHDLNVRPYEIIAGTKQIPTIGVISLIGPDMRKAHKDRVKFVKNNLEELQKALEAFAKAGVEFGIILHHEYPDVDEVKFPKGGARDVEIEAQRQKRALECAKFCADARAKNRKIPPIQLMALLVEEPEAPAFLKQLDAKLPTQTIEIGHKGKYVGLIGIYRDGKNLHIRHENVKMGPEWKTPEGKEKDNPVTALMEKYNDQLKRLDILSQYPRMPHFNQLPAADQNGLRATFKGSVSCKECHPAAFAKWEKTDHHLATKTLEDAKNPSGRHYDPECMKCHTTGLKHPGGYNDLVADLANWPAPPPIKPNAKQLQDHNDSLRGVGCESCHGPGSEHIERPNDTKLYALINPYRPTAAERQLEDQLKKNPGNNEVQQAFKRLFEPRMRHLSNFCTQCHNEDNDVNWYDKGVAASFRKISHRTPAKNNAGAGEPAAKIGEPPPFIIEVIENKK